MNVILMGTLIKAVELQDNNCNNMTKDNTNPKFVNIS